MFVAVIFGCYSSHGTQLFFFSWHLFASFVGSIIFFFSFFLSHFCVGIFLFYSVDTREAKEHGWALIKQHHFYILFLIISCFYYYFHFLYIFDIIFGWHQLWPLSFPSHFTPPTRQKQKRETLTLIHMKARGNGDSDASGKPRKHKYTHTQSIEPNLK